MITIVTDTDEEYEDMLECASTYICRHTPLARCHVKYNHDCEKCFKDNCVTVGIRVIPPIDNPEPKQL